MVSITITDTIGRVQSNHFQCTDAQVPIWPVGPLRWP